MHVRFRGGVLKLYHCAVTKHAALRLVTLSFIHHFLSPGTCEERVELRVALGLALGQACPLQSLRESAKEDDMMGWPVMDESIIQEYGRTNTACSAAVLEQHKGRVLERHEGY